MVPSTHTVVVCVMKGWRGLPLITVGLEKLFYVKRVVGGGSTGEHGAFKVGLQ